MLSYIVAFVLKTVYQVNVYMPGNIIGHLEKYFDNIDRDIIPAAEESLCGFKKFWRIYSEERRETVLKYVEEETLKRNNKQSRKSSNIVSVFHSSEMYKIEYEPGNKSLQHSSFPWTPFTRSSSDLLRRNEQYGKAYIFFPAGFLFSTFDDMFDEDSPLDTVPGLMEFTIKSFQFKKIYVDKCQDHLHLIKNKIKKRRKNKIKDVLFIGIHNRRSDHLHLQKEGGWITLEAGYFIEVGRTKTSEKCNQIFRPWTCTDSITLTTL